MLSKAVDNNYMSQVLTLARKGKGRTSPNPMVGAIVVKNNKVVGSGYHKKFGLAHAETVALKEAGSKTKGASLYVNLEPCCHIGKTGPCVDTIIKAGIVRVVIATKDSNPIVNGKGIRALKKAGIEVTLGIVKEDALKLNDKYFFYHKNNRPFIILKLAQSLDGKIATLTGDSKYLSSKESLKMVHQLRSETDAIVVGGRTFQNDNPALTVRLVKGENPYRIVLSKSIKINNKSKLFNQNSDFKSIIATTDSNVNKLCKSRSKNNLIYWSVKLNKNKKLDLNDFIEKANSFGLKSLLIEGGAELATSFLKEKLVDKLIVVTTPMIIGTGVNAFNNLNIMKINDSIKFNSYENFKLGNDNVFVGYPKYEK
jgi:diaminohydroxyphosphoribosylaminopyrimidine deaminase/5-amino-6-(5-phosphoribosylamino)uracil reductase